MMKKVFLMIFVAGVSCSLKGQFIMPSLADTAAQDLPEAEQATDTPQVKTVIQNAVAPAVEEKQKNSPVDDSLKMAELEVKKLEIRSQRLKLEREIAELNGKQNLTPDEQEILRLKNDNLKLVLQKEKMLLEQEIETAKVENTLKNLPDGVVYGHQYFRDNAFDFFKKTSEIIPTENYILGGGDVVQLEVWGYRYWSKSYVVSESGAIDIAGYQKIFVKGLSLKQARDLIGSRLGLTGNESSFSVTVTRPRQVTVNILGEVFRPGSYTLPATNTAFNALVSMGGPTNIGSVRNIYIKRDGKIRDSFDLYEYFADVRHQRDVFLQNNDYIIVMPLNNFVQINGSVRRPGSYEMKAGEGLRDLIRFAGGTFPQTYLKDVIVSRVRNNEYEILSVNLDSLYKKKSDFKLYGGEAIFLKEVRSDNQYTVLVSGAVSVPGTYHVREGMRISDLLQNANGFTSEAFMERGYVVRTNKDLTKTYLNFSPADLMKNKGTDMDFKVMNRDSVYIFDKNSLQKFYQVKLSGSVYKPKAISYIAGLKLGDFLFMGGGLTPDADSVSGYIIRTNSELDKTIIYFEPKRVITSTGMHDFELMPRDEVVILSRLANKQIYSVSISGAVFNAVTADFAAGMKLGNLVKIAGGLTPDADETKGFIIRTNNNFDKELISFEPGKLQSDKTLFDMDLQPRDEITIFSKSAFKRYYTLEIQGPVKAPKTIPYSDNTRISDIVNLAGGLELSAYTGRALIVLTNLENQSKAIKTFNLQNILDHPESAENIVLPRNAVVRIFDLLELRNGFNVSIYGEVRKSGDYNYADNMTLQNLVDMAGGFNFISAGTSIEVVRNFYLENGNYKFLKPRIYYTKVTQDLTLDSSLKTLVLQPFDRVFVRRNPDFMPLKMVYIDGAIRYPGYYALQSENEKLSSIYKRADGFRPDANLRGIKVKRARAAGDTLELVLNSRRAIHRKHSKYNVIVKNGDFIYVPYADNIVTLSGDLNKLTDNDIGVYYTKHKRAKYYIRNFGGGFTESSDRKHVTVLRANGARVSTKRVLFFRIYPKVKPGSKIVVNTKPAPAAKGGGKGPSMNIDTFLNKLLTRATAVLSLIGIYKIAVK